MTRQEAEECMNALGGERKPFLFIIDFEMKYPLIYPLESLPSEIKYQITSKPKTDLKREYKNLDIQPISQSEYGIQFNRVLEHLNFGNTYLLNLTCQTKIKSEHDLKEIYDESAAKYKLYLKDQFVVFSPEPFIKISNGQIRSFPMKGTIRDSVADASNVILNSKKEQAEHATIVDLIRNDLGMVSRAVRVNRYRFVERVATNTNNILQVSSEIIGDLQDNYIDNIGQIIFTLLPAGSISGAPKSKTLQIISEVETKSRGYFTGVFGVFDGSNVDSAVMIRFIEQTPNGLVYRSGGGITAQSILDEEYQEMIDKVYVPTY